MAESIKGISDISGFGGHYEATCQNMLQSGYEWLEANKDKIPKLKGMTYKQVYGIFEPNSKESKELSECVVKAAKGDCTGAMHQAVMSHLFFIAFNGVEKWKREAKKRR